MFPNIQILSPQKQGLRLPLICNINVKSDTKIFKIFSFDGLGGFYVNHLHLVEDDLILAASIPRSPYRDPDRQRQSNTYHNNTVNSLDIGCNRSKMIIYQEWDVQYQNNPNQDHYKMLNGFVCTAPLCRYFLFFFNSDRSVCILYHIADAAGPSAAPI